MNGYRARNNPKWLENDLGEQFTIERIKTPPRGREHAQKGE